MKSKLLTFLFLLAISIQILPVIEMAKYVNKMNAQKEICEDYTETEEDSLEKGADIQKISLDIQQHTIAEVCIINQAHLLMISIQAIHQYIPNIPTRPPVFS